MNNPNFHPNKPTNQWTSDEVSRHIAALYRDGDGYRVLVRYVATEAAVDLSHAGGARLEAALGDSDLIADFDTYDDDPTAIIWFLRPNWLALLLDGDDAAAVADGRAEAQRKYEASRPQRQRRNVLTGHFLR